MLNGKIRR